MTRPSPTPPAPSSSMGRARSPTSIAASPGAGRRNMTRRSPTYNKAIRLDPAGRQALLQPRLGVAAERGPRPGDRRLHRRGSRSIPSRTGRRPSRATGPAAAKGPQRQRADFLSTLPLEHAHAEVATPKVRIPADQPPASFRLIRPDSGTAADDQHRRRCEMNRRPGPAGGTPIPLVSRHVRHRRAPNRSRIHHAGRRLAAASKCMTRRLPTVTEAIELGSHDPLAHIYRGLAWSEKKELRQGDRRLQRGDPARSSERVRLLCALCGLEREETIRPGRRRSRPGSPARAGESRSRTTAAPGRGRRAPTRKYRDGRKAVEAATKACELTDWTEAGIIDTLAAAYAEIGDFASARSGRPRAIELETDPKNKEEFVGTGSSSTSRSSHTET